MTCTEQAFLPFVVAMGVVVYTTIVYQSGRASGKREEYDARNNRKPNQRKRKSRII